MFQTKTSKIVIAGYKLLSKMEKVVFVKHLIKDASFDKVKNLIEYEDLEREELIIKMANEIRTNFKYKS